MKKAAREPAFNPVLAENFNRLIQGMSVAKLRGEIGDIGSSAIQSAKQGSTGLRLETLEKIAAYFNLQPHQLLLPDLGRAAWPLKTLSYAEFVALPEQFHAAVENFAQPYVKSSQTLLPVGARRQETVSRRDSEGLVFVNHVLQKEGNGSGHSDTNEGASQPARKSGGHR